MLKKKMPSDKPFKISRVFWLEKQSFRGLNNSYFQRKKQLCIQTSDIHRLFFFFFTSEIPKALGLNDMKSREMLSQTGEEHTD